MYLVKDSLGGRLVGVAREEGVEEVGCYWKRGVNVSDDSDQSKVQYRREAGEKHTFSDFINTQVAKVNLLRMRTKRAFAIAEKVFSNLSLAVLALVLLVSINAAPGFVNFDDGNWFV